MHRQSPSHRWVIRLALFVVAIGCCLGGPRPTRADGPAAPRPISHFGDTVEHTFRFTPPAGEHPRAVFVAGDFNGWSTEATPMRFDGSSFTAVVKLSTELHHYKLVVDGRWLPDPAGDPSLEVDDGHGGKNSGVQIGLEPISDRPTGVDAADVSFDPADLQDCNIASTTELRLSFRARAHNLTGAAVLYQDKGAWVSTPLPKAETRGGFDRFGGLVTTRQTDLHYVLKLVAAAETAYVADGMVFNDVPTAQSQAYSVQLSPTFVTPDWARHAVWYQIFPERFRNGDRANDPPGALRWTSRWYTRTTNETGDAAGPVSRGVFDRRYGGDLQGIRDELPYLRSLGINSIYLNPIFQAQSLHKYDTSDYRHVDEHFGYAGDIEQLHGENDNPSTWQWTQSDKLFLELVAEAHRQGFRVIIDGVFNHVGTKFWAFQDVVQHGQSSRYAGWFDITDWTPSVNRSGELIPFHYRAWDGDNGSLPIFKKDPVLGIVHGPREHILAVAKRWLAPDGDASRGVDGFRLDAPENVPHPFWVDFRKTVKAINPNAYIDGEIWISALPWLSGDQFDAVMNYQFAIASQSFFVNQKTATTATQYGDALSATVYRYPLQAALVNQNLLDSHDTDRLASMFVNPDRDFGSSDRAAEYHVQAPPPLARTRMLQEVAMQMTFLGAPMIYYGDEAGMWGASDPADRQPMIWKDLGSYDDPQESFDEGKFAWYQRLIALRRGLPALQTGFFRTLPIGHVPGLLAFARSLPGQSVYVVVNRSPQARQVALPVAEEDRLRSAGYVDWLNPTAATLSPADPGQSDGRPRLILNDAAPVIALEGGTLHFAVAPWGVAVIGAGKSPRSP